MQWIRQLVSRVWSRFSEWILPKLPKWLSERLRFWGTSFGLMVGVLITIGIVRRSIDPSWPVVGSINSLHWSSILPIVFIFCALEGTYWKYAPMKLETNRRGRYDGLLPFHTQGQMFIAYCVGIQPYTGTDQELHANCLQWVQDTKAYIAQHFNPNRAALWDSIIADNLELTVSRNLSAERIGVLSITYPRLKKLEDIMKEVTQ